MFHRTHLLLHAREHQLSARHASGKAMGGEGGGGGGWGGGGGGGGETLLGINVHNLGSWARSSDRRCITLCGWGGCAVASAASSLQTLKIHPILSESASSLSLSSESKTPRHC